MRCARPLLTLGLALLATAPARGEVFASKESALRTAFPDADSFSSRAVVLSAEDVVRAERNSRTRIDSRLVNVHLAWHGDELLGYAYIETHDVRSLPETILVSVDPAGRTRAVHLLAFHEPPQYQPPAAWLHQFRNRPLDDQLALRRGLGGLSGSTLTANAVTGAVRRILAVHQVLSGDGSADDESRPALSRSP